MAVEQTQILKQIESWKERLVNLTQRNPLLRYRRTKRNNLEIISPDYETIFERLLKGKSWEFYLPPDLEENQSTSSGVQSTIDGVPALPPAERPELLQQPKQTELVCADLSRKDLEATLRNLRSKFQSEYNDHGLYILFVAFGQLVWKEIEYSNEVLNSPLILVPVTLTRESILEPYTVRLAPTEEQIVVNPALRAKLTNDFKVDLPDFEEETDTLSGYVSKILDLVKSKDWKVESKIVLGLYKFHKFAIYQDLTTNVQQISAHPIIQALTGAKQLDMIQEGLPDEKIIDQVEKPDQTFHVMNADGSQRVCIDYALRGQSFIMQGPPGTGKSQTIANIIAQCIANGKSVLFVSEKIAALDVVYNRLAETGLQRFCLMLHSDKANKKEVISELRKSLDEDYIVKELPTELQYASLISTRTKLNSYVNALHEVRWPLGKNAYQVLSELIRLRDVKYVPLSYANIQEVSPAELTKLEQIIQKLSFAWVVIEEEDFPWMNMSLDHFDAQIRSEILDTLNKLSDSITALWAEARRYSSGLELSNPSTFGDVEWLIDIGKEIRASPKPERRWIVSPTFEDLIQESNSMKETTTRYQRKRQELKSRYQDSIFSMDQDFEARFKRSYSNFLGGFYAISVTNGPQGLLLHRSDLSTILRSTEEVGSTSLEWIRKVSKTMGFERDDWTIEKTLYLVKLIEAVNNEDCPKNLNFLEPTKLVEIQNLLEQIVKSKELVKSRKEALGKRYNDRLYTLDLVDLISRLRESNSFRSFSSKFSSNYRRVKHEIEQASSAHNLPPSALDDLTIAAEVIRLGKKIEDDLSSLGKLVGGYYNGNQTDFARLDRIVKIARKILDLKASLKLEDVVDDFVVSGPLENSLKGQADIVQEQIKIWRQHWDELSSIVYAFEDHPKWVALDKRNLQELVNWSNQNSLSIDDLCKISSEILDLVRPGASPPNEYDVIFEDFQKLDDLRAIEKEFEENAEELRLKFGKRFNGIATDWDQINSALEWTMKFLEKFQRSSVSEAVIASVTENEVIAPSPVLTESFSECKKLLNSLALYFNGGKLEYRSQELLSLPLEVIQARVNTFIERIDEIQTWLDFLQCQKDCAENKLSTFYSGLFERRAKSAELLPIFRKSFFEEWLGDLWRKETALREFRREDHEKTVLQFREIDQELIRLASARVIERANSRKPHGAVLQAGDDEINILRRESAKARSQLPIRSLFRKIPNLLLRLKPCVLSNPLALSQFFTSDNTKFDVLLFDEASQIVPEDAICAIYRGKTVVVAGDNKQLPPTTFFESYDFDEDEELDESIANEKEVYDSILDKFQGIGLPAQMLKWHYRSKHEDLIAFSNRNFYDGKLITFPSPSAENPDLGVELVLVENGIYDRGGTRRNLEEAKKVAELVFQHFERNPGKSLIVVTFSISQKEAIEEILEEWRKRDQRFEDLFSNKVVADARLEGFDVKNLESVQGDERDVVIFSVGYGKDKEGKMTMNFGPLNKEGGERRLNVAITRAREKVIVVSSIRASDISIENAKPGVLKLHSYLDYAMRGPTALGTSDINPLANYESEFEIDVAEEIRKLGYGIKPQVGCSSYRIDLGVLHPSRPGRFILGVECDGATYHSSYSARDRDRLRQYELERQGWLIHRIWAPSWRSQRARELELLKKKLEQSVTKADNEDSNLFATPPGPQETKNSAPSLSTPKVETVPVQFTPLKDEIGVPYVRCPLKPQYNFRAIFEQDLMEVQSYRNEFSRLVKQLVKIEAPIHVEYAAQRLASSLGFGRAGTRFNDYLKRVCNSLAKPGIIEVRKGFLYDCKTAVQVRYPDQKDPDTRRVVEYISPEEIQLALRLILDHSTSRSLTKESLFQEASGLFGFARMGDQIRERLEDELHSMIEKGHAKLGNGSTVSM